MRLLLLLLCFVFLHACTAGNGDGLDANGRPIGENPTSDQPAPTASFKQIQDEIFTPQCIVCHAGAAAPVGLKLDEVNSYASLVSISSVEVPSLFRVNPGDAQQSYLLQKLTGEAAVGAQMPLGGPPVSNELIDAVRIWINNGALTDTPPDDNAPVIPQVITTVPANNATLQTPPAEVILVFNTPMDFSLVNSASIQLTHAGMDEVFDNADDTDIPVSSFTSPNNQTLIINLEALNLSNALYRLRLNGDDSMMLRSLASIDLDGDFDNLPGGNFDLIFNIQSQPAEAQATWRWIQDNVFTSICTQCHIEGGIASFLELDELNSFAMLVNQPSSQVSDLLLVEPNNANNSYLLQKIEGSAAIGSRMPLGLEPLNEPTVSAIALWINQGALLEPDDPMPDIIPPVASLAIPSGILSGIVSFNVAASDDREIVQVQLIIDQQTFAQLSGLPYHFEIDTSLLTDATHSVVAEAIDAAGNIGRSLEQSFEINNTPPVDTENPIIVIAPLADVVNGSINVGIAASDNTGVTEVRVFVDGVLQAVLDTAPYLFTLNTTTLANGDHSIGAEAQDAAGNIGQSDVLSFSVDNAPPPDIELPTVSVDPINSPVNGSIDIAVTANDNISVTEVRVLIDDVLFATLTTTPYLVMLDSTTLADGDHTIQAEALDAAGNIGQSDVLSFSVDNAPPLDLVPPTISVVSPAGSINGIATVEVLASDNSLVSSISLFVDNQLAETLQSPPFVFAVDVSSFDDGIHLFNATGTDDAGNVGAATPILVEVANGGPQNNLPWIQANIFSPSCAIGCHSDGGIASFLRLSDGDSFAQLVNIESDQGGPEFRVLPGDPDNSSLIQRLDGTLLPSMPLGGSLIPSDQLNAVRNWIVQGALETPADTISPAVSLVLPLAPATGVVTLSVNAIDDNNIVDVRFLVDGVEIGSDSTLPYETTLDTTVFTDGNYQIDAQVTDDSGNTGQAVTQTLFIQNN